jgi:uncharacterized protein DUF5670
MLSHQVHHAQAASCAGDGRAACASAGARKATMLWTIAAVLAALWLLGIVTSYTMGGLIYLLLVMAAVSVLLRFMSRRGPLLISAPLTQEMTGQKSGQL